MLLTIMCALFGTTSALATEMTFHVTVLDVGGAPMADIAVGVRSRGKATAGLTGPDGQAHVNIDCDSQCQLAVVYVGAFMLLDVSDSERSRLRDRSHWIEAAKPKEALIRLSATQNDYSLVMQYRAGRTLSARITETGAVPTQLWEIGTAHSGIGSPQIEPDGTFQLHLEPIDGGVVIEVYGDDTNADVPGRSMIVRIPAASIGPDGNLGTIDINPTIGPTGNVRLNLTAGSAAYRNVSALFEPSDWGLTLVKSDGRTVMSFFADADLHIANDPAVMPVGTWYVVPGSYFCWTWPQRRIVEACLNGVDLSTSGIPRIVVTTGANLDVNIDPVAAELAIQQYFLPPP